jgi:chorismate mutase
MPIRGIRGATTITADQADLVHEATQELLAAILTANPDLRLEDVGSTLFSVTEDITSAYPALAARQMGWDHVPMMCVREIPVKDSLQLCIRVLIDWNTNFNQDAIKHVYLRGASILRPDLSDGSGGKTS